MLKVLTLAVLLPLATTAAQAQSAPQTAQSANAEAAAQAAAPTPADAINAANQAQYQSDLAAYEQSLRASHHEAVRDQMHYQHQRRAYADAMAAWRHQVYACDHGSTRACNAPTPNPADFY
jgi:Skp family chaperone for outer membrane proteins